MNKSKVGVPNSAEIKKDSTSSIPSKRKWLVFVGAVLAPCMLMSIWGLIRTYPRLFVNKPIQLKLSECLSDQLNLALYSCPIKSEKGASVKYGLVASEITDEALTFGLLIRRTNLLMEQDQLRVQLKGNLTIHHKQNNTITLVKIDNLMQNKFASFKARSIDSHVFRYTTAAGIEPGDNLTVEINYIRIYKTVLGEMGRDFLQDGDVGITFIAEQDPYKKVYFRIMAVKGALFLFLVMIILNHLSDVLTSFKSKAAYKWKDLFSLALLFLIIVDMIPDSILAWFTNNSTSNVIIQQHFSSLKTMLIHHVASSVLTSAFNFYSLVHFVGKYKWFQYIIMALAIVTTLGLYSRLGILVDTYAIAEPLHDMQQLGYRSHIIAKIDLIMHSASVGLGLLLPVLSIIVAQLKPQDKNQGSSHSSAGNCFYTIAFGSTFLAFQAYIIGKRFYIGDWNLWRVIVERSLIVVAVAVFAWIPALENFGCLSLDKIQISKLSQDISIHNDDEEGHSLNINK
jgi:hypothetical protein